MLNSVKGALRISASNSLLDGEIIDLIEAARDDLRLSGVLASKVIDDHDSLIKRAITTYVKANFGFDNAEAERFQRSYESLKAHLTLSQEYTVESDV